MRYVVNGRTVTAEEFRAMHPERASAFVCELKQRKCARVATEDSMLAQYGTLDQQLKCPITRKAVIRNARKYGYNPKPTDVYMPTLVPPGALPGHPDAFLSHTEGGRSKIKRVTEQRGAEYGVESSDEGWVKTKAIQRRGGESKPIRLAKDIQERIYKERVTADPALGRKRKRDVLEQIVADHGAK